MPASTVDGYGSVSASHFAVPTDRAAGGRALYVVRGTWLGYQTQTRAVDNMPLSPRAHHFTQPLCFWR